MTEAKPPKLPRGIRNNNPGNIRIGIKWQGLDPKQADGAFCQFLTPEAGLRALMKILLSYDKKYGLRTVRGMISRWAPPVENDTESYIAAVSKALGVGENEALELTATTLIALARAIVAHENGRRKEWYTLGVYSEAAKMALRGF